MGQTRTRYDLDQSFVDRLKATGKIGYYWDLRQRGLFVRVTPKGSRSYGLTLQRADTKKVHMTLGACSMPGTKGQKEGALSLAAARQKAGDLIQKHKEGGDVLSEMAKTRKPNSLQSLVEFWLETEAPKLKPTTRASYASIINGVILPTFGKRLVSGLSFEEISKWFSKLRSKTPIQANRASWILQGLFRLAESLGQIPRGSNPCVSLTRTKEAPRKRILSAEELHRLEVSLQTLVKRQALNPIHADLVRLICFTGLRRGEALGLKFSDVDIDRRVIRFLKHKTDSEGSKLVPVNSHAAALLAQLANRNLSDFVFPGIDSAKPFNGFGKVWERIREEANLLDVTPHDLRRTFGSTAAELGHGGLVADKLLGHQVGRIQETYQSLSPTGLLGRASQESADWIQGAMNGIPVQVGVKHA